MPAATALSAAAPVASSSADATGAATERTILRHFAKVQAELAAHLPSQVQAAVSPSRLAGMLLVDACVRRLWRANGIDEPAAAPTEEIARAGQNFNWPRFGDEFVEDLTGLANAAGLLGTIYERCVLLARDENDTSARRRQGFFSTPTEIARRMSGEAITSWRQQHEQLATESSSGQPTPARLLQKLLCVQVLDPAAGCGALLCAMATETLQLATNLREQATRDNKETRFPSMSAIRRRIWDNLYGVEVDPMAAAICRLRVWLACGQPRPKELNNRVIVADALTDDWHLKMGRKHFDVVIANPPYQSARVLLQTAGKAYKASLTQKYQTAQGLFDLFVPFGELTLKHTRPNGTAVLIVPNKLAAADYAHALRRHISTRRVLKVIDLGRVTPFRSVSAYPLIAVIQNQSPPDGVQVVIMTEESAGATATDTATDTAADTAGRYAQREAIPRDGGPWRLSLGDNTDKRQTAPGRRQALSSAAKPNHSVVPLAAVASLQAGITGFAAQRALTAVREEAALSRSDRRTAMPLIVTGGIDPYRIRFGETRFINRRFDRPMVVPNADAISAGKLKLFSKPKLVIGGMTRRVEAAYAPQPTAVGVQVFCITDWQVDPYFLLAVLNSDYASDWYYRQYRSKHLAGGYLSITKGHLKTLPIPLATTAEQQSVAELVKDLLRRIKDQGIDTNGRPTAPYEQEISRRVSQCFGNAGG